MYRHERNTGAGNYDYDLQNYINGFGEPDMSQPYWLGLKNMKRITDNGGKIKMIVLHNEERWSDHYNDFKITDNEYRMTYGSHHPSKYGGLSLIKFFYFP